ncbi:hypothetical protein QE152_g9534 [Popillia japonica]|uniref:Uncharacterized protein n=1 Tax=Popillia japonica TaxID=7064 RepID=A0AAW1LUG1_POPJA
MLNQYENIQEQIEELADIECEDSEREEFERKYFHSVGLGVNTHTRSESGRFIVKLPFKGDPNSLGDTYSVALKRFHNLEKRLNKDVDLKMQNADCNEIAYQIPKGLIIPEERRGIVGLPNIYETPNNLFTRYSSLSKLIRVTAYCLRARRCLIKLVQRETYASELSQLKLSGTVNRKSPLITLNPLIDEHGIIRVGGRLQKANISYSHQHSSRRKIAEGEYIVFASTPDSTTVEAPIHLNTR